MDPVNPTAPFLSANEASVIRALTRTSSDLTGRKAAALAGVPPSTARRILERFTDLGVVTVAPLGSSYAYGLNRDHIAWPTVQSALETRQRLFDRWSELLAEVGPAESDLMLFGSSARGDGDPDSDFDLLLVTPDGEHPDELIWALSERTWAWTRRDAQVYHLSRSELADHVVRADPLVDAWRADGIRIAGRPLSTLLRSAA